MRLALLREAIGWHVALQDSNTTAHKRGVFYAWLMSSPAHVDAFLVAARRLSKRRFLQITDPTLSIEELTKAALADHSENVIPLREPPPGVGRVSSRLFVLGLSLVLLTLAGLIGTGGWFMYSHWLDPDHIQTRIGEQRSIALADGSVVQLNTDSEVRIDLNEHDRRVHLIKGEARFTVAHDAARPFLVGTPKATVRALGTVFNVQVARRGTIDVAVLEGHVEVQSIRRLVLTSGRQAAVTKTGEILPDTGPPMEWAMYWPERKLVFRDSHLAEVIAETNRYNTRVIRIRNPKVADLRVSGTFMATDVPSLCEYLRRYRGVRVNYRADGDIDLDSERAVFPQLKRQ